MGLVDYTFNIVRSPLDLLHILIYITLWVIIIAYAFYNNSKEDCDALTQNIPVIWLENILRMLCYKLANINKSEWTFRSYEMGRLDFLFSSSRLPFFIVKIQVYSNQAKNDYNNFYFNGVEYMLKFPNIFNF